MLLPFLIPDQAMSLIQWPDTCVFVPRCAPRYVCLRQKYKRTYPNISYLLPFWFSHWLDVCNIRRSNYLAATIRYCSKPSIPVVILSLLLHLEDILRLWFSRQKNNISTSGNRMRVPEALMFETSYFTGNPLVVDKLEKAQVVVYTP